eukprot:TRINITY_DN21561_c0_g1_i2.p1 TRINITY_DN21561_c0_g1~~TRINITY_DN21561_c0_g1_i2.p1  ORF type:complete len:508 (-),score=106.26 TRINITY_DN21561_c0_g1_i2:22-1545(-)
MGPERRLVGVVGVVWVVGLVGLGTAADVSSMTNPSDRHALLALHATTGGETWLNKWPADGGGDPCQDNWHGIGCEEGRVVSLELPANNLRGGLPTQWEPDTLSHLRVLDLNSNFLYEEGVFEATTHFTDLRLLDLSHANIGGSIPLSLGRLTHLRVLQLHNNALQGPIPEGALSSLLALREVSFSSNRLEGALPLSLAELVSLESLSLPDNLLTGRLDRVPWERLTSLRSLDMAQNMLTGQVPGSLGDLVEYGALRTLVLRDNQLYGRLPPQLDTSALTTLDLSGNVIFCDGVAPHTTFCTPVALLGVTPQHVSMCGDARITVRGHDFVTSAPDWMCVLRSEDTEWQVPADVVDSLTLLCAVPRIPGGVQVEKASPLYLTLEAGGIVIPGDRDGNAATYTLSWRDPALTMTRITPSQGPVGGGTRVTVFGTGMQWSADRTMMCYFGESAAVYVDSMSVTDDSSSAVCVTPRVMVPGVVDVSISDVDGERSCQQVLFEFVGNAAVEGM